jgi:hypothetical protein
MFFTKTYYSTIRSNISRTGQTKDGHTYRRLDDLPNLAPTSLNNTLQILERLACLRFHTALDEVAGLGIEAEASGDEHKGWAHDGLTIWPHHPGCICSTILIAVALAQELEYKTLRGTYFRLRLFSARGV